MRLGKFTRPSESLQGHFQVLMKHNTSMTHILCVLCVCNIFPTQPLLLHKVKENQRDSQIFEVLLPGKM